MTDHPPPTGDEAPNLLLPPDAARAVAALIAAGEDIIFLVGDLDQYDHCEPCDVCNRARRVHAALADPALAALRRTLAGNDAP